MFSGALAFVVLVINEAVLILEGAHLAALALRLDRLV